MKIVIQVDDKILSEEIAVMLASRDDVQTFLLELLVKLLKRHAASAKIE